MVYVMKWHFVRILFIAKNYTFPTESKSILQKNAIVVELLAFKVEKMVFQAAFLRNALETIIHNPFLQHESGKNVSEESPRL
jgi:hypothetical protein